MRLNDARSNCKRTKNVDGYTYNEYQFITQRRQFVKRFFVNSINNIALSCNFQYTYDNYIPKKFKLSVLLVDNLFIHLFMPRAFFFLVFLFVVARTNSRSWRQTQKRNMKIMKLKTITKCIKWMFHLFGTIDSHLYSNFSFIISCSLLLPDVKPRQRLVGMVYKCYWYVFKHILSYW